MGRYGRRSGVVLGALAGGIGGTLCARALFVGRFELFLLGAAFTGVYQAFQGFFRFAAADTGSETFKPKAISYVFAGGLLSALIGPEIVRWTTGTFVPTPYVGAYIAIVGLKVVGALGMLFLDIPVPPRTRGAAGSGRPLCVIARQPTFIVAVMCAMVGFAAMNLVMT
jgi:hypothetical protein